MTNIVKKSILFLILFFLITFTYSEEKKYYFPEEERYSSLNIIYSSEYDYLDAECIYQLGNEENVIRILYTSSAYIDFLIKIVWNIEHPYVLYCEGLKNEFDESLEKTYYSKKYIKNSEAELMEQYIQNNNLFESPFRIYNSSRDGYSIIVELNLNGRYKIIKRDTPRTGEVYDFYQYILDFCKSLKILPAE